MRITNSTQNFLIDEDKPLINALDMIEKNNHGIVFTTDQTGQLNGSLTDGDIRRALKSQQKLATEIQIKQVANKNFTSLGIDLTEEHFDKYFTTSIQIIPLTNAYNRVVGLAFNEMDYLQLGDKFQISSVSPAFIIAEIGNNHNGKLSNAKTLVDKAIEAGADCVKFQIRDLEELYLESEQLADTSDLGVEYTKDLLNKFQLDKKSYKELFEYCKEKGVFSFCTPWDMASVDFLESLEIDAYKIASADLTNHLLIKKIAQTKKPMIISTGMSTENEIKQTYDLLKSVAASYAFLHCNSTYPTPFKDVNLNYLENLKKYSSVVGYSGHERGWAIPVAAIAMGAKIIEKHFTLDRQMEGNDHKVSLLPDEFQKMVTDIRHVEQALGNEVPVRSLSQGELINRENLSKSLYAKRKIKKNEKVQRDDIGIKSPGQGLQPNLINSLVGRTLNRTINPGGLFFQSDLEEGAERNNRFLFNRKFGLPVRYHDFELMKNLANVDFLEFHLSYADLTLNYNEYLKTQHDLDFTVHCPELFENDHLLDLTSENDEYRGASIQRLNRVCQLTRNLKQYFTNSTTPKIIVNIGGFHFDGFLNTKERLSKYEKLKESLLEIDLTDVELAIQTMPPFPWHFGGQSHHNLFVRPNEIASFCEETGFKICLDISHSSMACKYYGWDLNNFIRTVSDHITYLHVADAVGIDGEGVALGEGDVDFKSTMQILDKICPNAPFIPEVWQGHKDNGYGFLAALNYLSNLQVTRG